jgi:hypothetical protein
MKFVMNRSKVVSGHGHAIEFVKGEPTHVPPELYREVMAAGGVSEEEVDLDKPAPVPAGAPTDPTEREEAVFAAFETLVETNDSKNFTAGGVPHPKALKSLLGWELSAKERDTLWVKFKTKDE